MQKVTSKNVFEKNVYMINTDRVWQALKTNIAAHHGN